MIPNSQHSHGQCNICLDTMKTEAFDKNAKGKCSFRENNHVVRLSCGHAYHSQCMDGQLTAGTSTCPDCRTPISERDIQYIGKGLEKNYVRRGAQDVAREVMHEQRQNTDCTSRENVSLWGCDAGVVNNSHFRPVTMTPNYYEHTSHFEDFVAQILIMRILTEMAIMEALLSEEPDRTTHRPARVNNTTYRFRSKPPQQFPVQRRESFFPFSSGFHSVNYPGTIRATFLVC